MSIHPTAIVHPNATLGENVSVGAFAIIEEGTSIGDNCVIEAAAQIRKGVTLGANCEIGSASILGSAPQFKGFDKTIQSEVIIGSDNVLRENSTVHRSIFEEGATVVGNDNYFMTGSHIGHDSLVGDHNTFANGVQLGGHVTMGNNVFVGGGSMFHQFVRVGDYVMCQGLSGFSQDLPPYVIGAEINEVVGINLIGLKRAGIEPKDRIAIKDAFKRVYRSHETLKEVLAEIEPDEIGEAVSVFYNFLSEPSKKGVCIRSSKR
ncbi:acyl-ACP--UDP-N-acetylglucosamine O-acyltransferase [Verrucomicrobiales bacterium]|jgi:UDP-N-acetylglucosamine acyltransferase|nr:acyl-ACP--UDP-N-acetylglucosamine O-acyltransferase [Verrucomicrobiales bacterium]|tara:strand:- start:1252 stop:2037 length:786 start_codon:yes stop_codon:yes gene_type:complete